MYILGVNAYHGDSSACIVRDGVLVAAIEEERIRRVKHWAGLPTEAITFCLAEAGLTLADVDAIAVSRDPKAHLAKKVIFTLKKRPDISSLIDRLKNRRKVGGLASELAKVFNISEEVVAKKLHNVEHHRAHIASAFFVSPFEESAVLSIDGMGDFMSTQWGKGSGNRFQVTGGVYYPHSLGFLYTAVTQYLGFPKYGDEYKVMGLSGFGKPEYLDTFRKVLHLKPDGSFELDLKYFTHDKIGVAMSWEGGEPVIGNLYSEELVKLLGPARRAEEPVEKRHQDIAASLQAMYEEALWHILKHLHQESGSTNLSFAGGVAQNSLANGKIRTHSPFKEVYIPPAGHDGGTAVGAAYYVWNEELGNARSFEMKTAFWGAQYKDEAVKAALEKAGLKGVRLDDDKLFPHVASLIANGKIIGWFQGKTEWGPRALGNRSILADPANKDIKEFLNVKIKRREPFRPFAPSILEECVGEYFEESYPVPFMEKVYSIRPEVRDKIPAVVHVDGTGRLQSVSKATNPRYWRLIDEVGKRTGVPIVLNTSFNENEPIVNTPAEAIACFVRTKMDALVLGNFVVERTS